MGQLVDTLPGNGGRTSSREVGPLRREACPSARVRTFTPGWGNLKEFANELLERVRKVANDHADDAFANGFDEAAKICVGLLSETTEGLMKKISSR